MSISYVVSALIACGFTCIVGAYGMRVYFVRNREIADREDPRDTQLRDLQATLQVVRKDAVERKARAEDASTHLEFAHDRINELLQKGKDTSENLDACKELLRTKIIEREQLHDQFCAAEKQVNALKERLEEVELELSMSNDSGNMLDPAMAEQVSGQVAGSDAEVLALKTRLQEAEQKLSTAASGESPGALSDEERKELENTLSATQDRMFVAERKLADAQERVSAAESRLSAAQQRISAAEGQLSALQERISAAEGKLSAAEKEAQVRVADALDQHRAAEKAGEDRIADTLNKLRAAEMRAVETQDRLNAVEKTAQEKLAAAQQRIAAAERAAEETFLVSQREVDTLTDQLQEADLKLADAEAARQTLEAESQVLEQNSNAGQSAGQSGNEGSSELFNSTVEDGSPSLIQCLNEELDRWKRHCHVLGGELKQQREQFAQKLAEQEAAEGSQESPVGGVLSESDAEPERSAIEEQPKPAEEPAEAAAAGNGASDEIDELTDIRGIGKVIAGKLRELGIYRYEQLASLNEDDLDRVQVLIPDFERRMRRDNWMEQAQALHTSKYSDLSE